MRQLRHQTLFSYQIFIRAETTPSVEFVLGHTREVSSDKVVDARAERDRTPMRLHLSNGRRTRA